MNLSLDSSADRFSRPPLSSGNPAVRMLRAAVEGNYFYVFSALLMMLGSYWLIASPLVSGSAFVRTLKSLFVLQGYEVLVIATAGWIVWRFGKLGDAFTLLGIELVLLLDPTFFSNAFITIPNVESPPVNVLWVNGTCFALVAVKLVVLQGLLGFRLSARALGSFLLAGVFVYLAEAPLNQNGGPLGKAEYYYMLAWAPFLLAAAFPVLGAGIRWRESPEGFTTPRQRAWLSRLVVLAPLLIVAAHILESSRVYGIRFYWVYGAPLLLTPAVLLVRNLRRETVLRRIAFVDVLCALAILVSIRLVGVQGKAAAFHVADTLPAFLDGTLPLMICGLAVAGLYLFTWWRHAYVPALLRVALLGIGGIALGLVKLGVIAAGMKLTGNAIGAVVEFIETYPSVIWWTIGTVLLIIALSAPRYLTWFLFGLYAVALGAKSLPGGISSWIPEALQAVVVIGLVLSHVYHGEEARKGRYWAAALLGFLGTARFLLDARGWFGAIALVEATGLVAAGLLVRHRGYWLMGIAQLLVSAVIVLHRLPGHVPPAAIALAAGMVLFMIGILVTIYKETILDWMNHSVAPVSVPPVDTREEEKRG